jgi:hypothetical protein
MNRPALLACSLVALTACSSSSPSGVGPKDGGTTDSSHVDSSAAMGGDSSAPGQDSSTADTSAQAQDSSVIDSSQGDSASPVADGSSPVDATVVDSTSPANDAEIAHCGQPGDVGNSIGVGKYCASETDCLGNMQATICSNLGGPGTNFCTTLCTASDASNPCGAGATCECQGGQCGCTPNYCL